MTEAGTGLFMISDQVIAMGRVGPETVLSNAALARYNRLGKSTEDQKLEKASQTKASTDTLEQETEARQQGKRRKQPRPAVLSPQGRDRLEALAHALGLPGWHLDPAGFYQFQWNPATGLIDLVEAYQQQVVISLSPKEIQRVASALAETEGLMADCQG